jgi:NAD(P)-dependent dehydrogenase (short-subunit alcohol dehydrogenase family)
MRFEKKVIIVTGAGGGIGIAIAKLFFSEGAKVVLADINIDKLKEAKQQIDGGSENLLPIACDVSREDEVKSLVDQTVTKFGQLDVVVNNAGLMVFKPLQEHTYEDWNRVLSVDLMGAFYFTKQAFLQMKNGGSIINISSIHALETTPMVASYAAAKAALLSLTRSASIEGKARNIRVNAILPGAIDTPMLWENPNIKAGLEVVNKDSVGKPADIAAVTAFLASEQAAFVQGAMVEVDGGRLNRL